MAESRGQDGAVPIRNAGVSQGISLAIDVGFGRLRRVGSASGDDRSRAISGSGSVGFGPLGLTVGVSRVTIDPVAGPDRTSSVLTGAAQFTVFGGPLVPLKVVWQAGADRSLAGGSGAPWRGWGGIGAALTIPAAVLSIKPWIAPRVDYIGTRPLTGGRFKTALSAGVDLGLLNGWGVRAGYDSRLGWSSGDTPASGVSIGASYHFR